MTVALSTMSLGMTATLGQDHEKAMGLLRESLQTLRELGSNLYVAENLEALAEVAVARENMERAARLWGAAGALRELTGNPWAPNERALHEPRLAEARSRLGVPEWEKAWNEGRTLSPDRAVSYALDEGTAVRG